MLIMTIIITLLLLWTVQYLYRVKRDLQLLKRDLAQIVASDTNMRLVTSTTDKDLVQFAAVVNDLLAQHRLVEREIKTANRKFKQGITNISHDLRTPLTSAKGYIGLIKTAPEDKRLAYLAIVEERLESLTYLMNQLFDYTQLVEGKRLLKLQKINLTDLIQNEMLSHYDVLTEQQFSVNLNISPDCWLITDEELFRRLIQNLLANVLKHGTDFIDVSLDEHGLVMKNKFDDGAELDMTQIFDRFYTNDESRQKGQTGLGLAIVKEIVTLIGGCIKAYVEKDVFVIEITFKNK